MRMQLAAAYMLACPDGHGLYSGSPTGQVHSVVIVLLCSFRPIAPERSPAPCLLCPAGWAPTPQWLSAHCSVVNNLQYVPCCLLCRLGPTPSALQAYQDARMERVQAITVRAACMECDSYTARAGNHS